MKVVQKNSPSLYQSLSSFSSFLPISPLDPKGEEKARQHIFQNNYPRQELASLLRSYNHSINNDDSAVEKALDLLVQDQSVCVLTGQQVGLFGGPFYTILKAISCVVFAKKRGAVPIFWLASEDHDVAEINHTFLVDSFGNLKKFQLSFPEGVFVEDLHLTKEHAPVIRSFFEAVGFPEKAETILQETSFVKVMTKELVALFKETGLLFVEPSLLRHLARPFFKKELEEREAIHSVLQDTSKELKEKGGQILLDIDLGTNLFFKTEKALRKKIIPEGENFRIGKELLSLQTLLERVESMPDRFSTNAAARCVLQNVLFPVLAYVAGPGELTYFHQLQKYHEWHGASLPWVVPRASGTLLTKDVQEMLEKCQLSPWEPLPTDWKPVFPEIDAGMELLIQDWQKAGEKHLGKDLSKEALVRFVKHHAEALQKKVRQERLKKEGISTYTLHYLHNYLHPHQKLQERVLNGWQFQKNCRENVVQNLLEHLEKNDVEELWGWKDGHYYFYL